MIAILAEKPSVGKEIARVLNVKGKGDGFLHGNGYAVTWAYGHLVTLALPPDYGFTKPVAADLPMVPNPFRLIVRRKKVAKGMVTDNTAARQLNVIKKIFDQCDSIVVATDAGREGELIFRHIYQYLECTKPFKRLWINSLTDEAIRKGFEDMHDGAEFDNLYRAADCRSKADWLVGINASQALCIASGTHNNSLGRVQTPTLAMICSRYIENRHFLPTPYWQLSITLEKGGVFRPFTAVQNITDPKMADVCFRGLKTNTTAKITKVEKKRVKQPAPLLYDLTGLQKDANIHFDMSAERTLEVAQHLYERKLISYPRTGSSHIPQDVFAQIPALLEKILQIKEFASHKMPATLNTRSVDDSKVTDHHALLITGIAPETFKDEERQIYNLVAGRMLEAFWPECVKETMLVEAVCGAFTFASRGSRIITPGWRGINNRKCDKDKDEEGGGNMPAFTPEETLPVGGYNLSEKKTTPRPLYTEATLLAAMENAGRELSDKEQREAIKDTGIGTPATRAAIISTLFAREYIDRSAKSIIPTEKGLYIYNAVRNMRVADVELTGSWEQSLAAIGRGEQSADTFMQAIDVYTRQVTSELLALQFRDGVTGSFACPKCKTGRVTLHVKIARCNNSYCGLVVFRKFLNKELSDQHVEQLLSSGTTHLIKGFQGKRGNTFDAAIAFDKNFNTEFSFPEKQKAKAVVAKSTKLKK